MLGKNRVFLNVRGNKIPEANQNQLGKGTPNNKPTILDVLQNTLPKRVSSTMRKILPSIPICGDLGGGGVQKHDVAQADAEGVVYLALTASQKTSGKQNQKVNQANVAAHLATSRRRLQEELQAQHK